MGRRREEEEEEAVGGWEAGVGATEASRALVTA